MKRFLFDHNLSPKLVLRLADFYPDSVHVSHLGLDSASDKEIWEYARNHDYIIVTKDADFGDFSVVWGIPRRSSGFAEETVRPAISNRFFGEIMRQLFNSVTILL